MIQTANATVHLGSNLDILPTLPDNSVDSIVTDPPYELGFMGKSWDSSGIAYSTELWAECLRVLKPGGHLLAFGGSRTWHRIAVAIEDSGFQIRDSIAWMYGSGFPKSLDVSKAIDKTDASAERMKRNLTFTAWMRSTGITSEQINEATGTSMASHYLTDKSQPAIATADLFDQLRPYLPEVPEEIEKLVADRTVESENFKSREVVGTKTAGIANKEEGQRHTIGAGKSVEVNITEAATKEAKTWEGWGTALKPAFEPVIVARKPLIGTVAENVLQYGTGGLNIDASRIQGNKPSKPQPSLRPNGKDSGHALGTGKGRNGEMSDNAQGRWPANVILDEYTTGLLDEQSDASRFFYVAKASKRDRNEGLEGLEAQDTSMIEAVVRGDGTRGTTRQNFHPTVKPTDLMRYLVKLVTPPDGTVLDPFTGSGSTGKAAILEGFKFIGCELTEDYFPIIEGRLIHAEQTKLAAEKEKEGELF